MEELSYTIKDKSGIHARPAGLLVKKVKEFESSITLTKGDKTVDLGRLFALMSLAVKQNDTVVIKAEGPDEAKAIKEIKGLMEAEGL
jgi:phosphocarrier protein